MERSCQPGGNSKERRMAGAVSSLEGRSQTLDSWVIGGKTESGHRGQKSGEKFSSNHLCFLVQKEKQDHHQIVKVQRIKLNNTPSGKTETPSRDGLRRTGPLPSLHRQTAARVQDRTRCAATHGVLTLAHAVQVRRATHSEKCLKEVKLSTVKSDLVVTSASAPVQTRTITTDRFQFYKPRSNFFMYFNLVVFWQGRRGRENGEVGILFVCLKLGEIPIY